MILTSFRGGYPRHQYSKFLFKLTTRITTFVLLIRPVMGLTRVRRLLSVVVRRRLSVVVRRRLSVVVRLLRRVVVQRCLLLKQSICSSLGPVRASRRTQMVSSGLCLCKKWCLSPCVLAKSATLSRRRRAVMWRCTITTSVRAIQTTIR